MGIFSRLEEALKSYLNGGEERVFGRSSDGGFPSGDPDLEAAWEELDDYLGTKKNASGAEDPRTEERDAGRKQKEPPPGLRSDYAELGVPFGAPLDQCKAAYKKLLKIHHPDKHAGHAANMRKATEKSARINAAMDRIANYSETM